MKKTINNYKKMTVAFATVLTMGFSTAAFATGDPVEPKSELVLLGKINMQPVFQLALNNSNAGEYTITVKDSDKSVLFSENVKGANILRKYKLDAEENSLIDGTTFEVTNRVTKETTVYKINNSSYAVEDVVIAKL